ncbi:MAG TPA: hypothetical protein VH989_01970 [Actinomycetota bacterium]
MKRRNDPLFDTLRRANPEPEGSTAGWHATKEGKRVAALALVDVLEAPPTGRPTRNRLVIVLVAAALATSALAAGFALGSREPVTVTTETAFCHDSLRQVASGFVEPLQGRTPVHACRAVWMADFGVPAPARLIACMNYNGGIDVYPVLEDRDPAEVCRSIDAAPYDPGLTP